MNWNQQQKLSLNCYTKTKQNERQIGQKSNGISKIFKTYYHSTEF